MNTVVILGASDPEMAAIERLARTAGFFVNYATVNGERVDVGNAYQADTPNSVLPVGHSTIIAVECDWQHRDGEDGDVICIDHHRPGDPGYGLPPERYLEASSIGQFLRYIATTVSDTVILARCGLVWPYGHPADSLARGQWGEWQGRDLIGCYDGTRRVRRATLFAAAADHCLGAAYRGQCPGVHPDELMRWRVYTRAEFQNRPGAELLEDVERARSILRSAFPIILDVTSCWCSDSDHPSERNPKTNHRHNCGLVTATYLVGMPRIPELPEAAAREGICFIAEAGTSEDGRVKIVCQAGSPTQIQAFFSWAEKQGIRSLYGDPARGFAGGYLKLEV